MTLELLSVKYNNFIQELTHPLSCPLDLLLGGHWPKLKESTIWSLRMRTVKNTNLFLITAPVTPGHAGSPSYLRPFSDLCQANPSSFSQLWLLLFTVSFTHLKGTGFFFFLPIEPIAHILASD